MARKRKRLQSEASQSNVRKSPRLANETLCAERPKPQRIHHAVLSLYYPRVTSLRDYCLSMLPSTSRVRRRKITFWGFPKSSSRPRADNFAQKPVDIVDDVALSLASLLDTTLVGICRGNDLELERERQKDFMAFSQSQFRQSLNSSGISPSCSQLGIIDYAIHTIFRQSALSGSYFGPDHLLCQGFRRTRPDSSNKTHGFESRIPGLVVQYPNHAISVLTSAPWSELFRLLGESADAIWRHLLLDCGVFVRLEGGVDNFYQLCGARLDELPLRGNEAVSTQPPDSILTSKAQQSQKAQANPPLNTPNHITFVRSRILYARPALNAKGQVRFGLKHIHVLNRYSDINNVRHSVHIMKYIFPRQFALHNVFTSPVDKKETVQPFKDYTLREHEIALKEGRRTTKMSNQAVKARDGQQIPKRLRGELLSLIQRLQRNHTTCSYTQLLRHHCSDDMISKSYLVANYGGSTATQTSTGKLITQLPPSLSGRSSTASSPEQQGVELKTPIEEYSTSATSVSAFCRSVLQKIIPARFFGEGVEGKQNRHVIMRHVDRFISMRRYEALSLHEVLQGIKLMCIKWLVPPSQQPAAKLARTETAKRTEIFMEFIYYLFDSVLVPLIQANFYVTESSIHKYRLFYFRHDIWRTLSESSLRDLRLSMFDEIKPDTVRKLFRSRTLGYSRLRLCPKATGMRPLINLKRRVMRKQNGKIVLEASINSHMTPVFNMLSYEKKQRPEILGSAMFSVGEIYSRLKAFLSAPRTAANDSPLYFVKVDVKSCFDTIPQRRIMQLVRRLVSESHYLIGKHAEIRPPDAHEETRWWGARTKPFKKYIGRAHTAELSDMGRAASEDLATAKRRCVYVDTGKQATYETQRLLHLLEEHVQSNIVRIGKRYFRQKRGIPQGSVISTLLCSIFYGVMEHNCLGFLADGDGVLLRMIDDFLLITHSLDHARQFLQVMIDGIPAYGISVNPHKSLVNFDVSLCGTKIPRLHGTSQFPYCGTLIDTRTLEVCRMRERRGGSLSDSLTIELSKSPGATFHRKVLRSFKIQAHAMYLDTSFNSRKRVLSNLYQNFVECAMKMHGYIKGLSRAKQPSTAFLIETVASLINLAFNLAQGGRRVGSLEGPRSSITKSQIRWLAAAAFQQVLQRKQSRYTDLVRWLGDTAEASSRSMGAEMVKLKALVLESKKVLEECKY